MVTTVSYPDTVQSCNASSLLRNGFRSRRGSWWK